MNPRCHINVVWLIYMAHRKISFWGLRCGWVGFDYYYFLFRETKWNVHEVEVVLTISVSVIYFLHTCNIYNICDVMYSTCYVFCCTWYVFAVVLKVKKASSSQNRGGLPTIYYIYIWILPITNIGLKTTPGNAWYLVPRLIYCTCTGVIPDA